MSMTPLRATWGKVALALSLSVFPAAAVAAEEPAKPLNPLQKELKTIRDMLHNANMKFHEGVMDVSPSGTDIEATPALLCCSGNLEFIDKSMTKVRDIVRTRTTCFERKRDIQGVEIANVAVRDMRVMASSIQLFVESEARRDVQGALASCTRAYLRMSDTLEALPECKLETAADAGD